ncbi:MAG: helix-turn-helix domain-containing protein [Cyanobium sp. PLM2.Bin73]|nr:MAG: helix-turn-helix domain-containing protein [Cyanobium sp. PLM2.Bin73]
MSADANPALQQLGQRLSEARQACGITLEQHADRLNMGREQLQALEAGDREGLPEPVFVIAQARRVATSLGIQIDEEIAALRSSDGFQTPRATRAPAERSQQDAAATSETPPSAPRSAPAQQRPTAWPLPLMALITLLVAASALLALRQVARRPANPPDREAAGTVLEPVADAARPSASADPGADQGPGPGELVLQPIQPSWVEVRGADGTTLFRGSLEQEQRFPLATRLEVLAGRPDLVQVSLGEAPAEAMGAIEDVRWRRFSADPAPAP